MHSPLECRPEVDRVARTGEHREGKMEGGQAVVGPVSEVVFPLLGATVEFTASDVCRRKETTLLVEHRAFGSGAAGGHGVVGAHVCEL